MSQADKCRSGWQFSHSVGTRGSQHKEAILHAGFINWNSRIMANSKIIQLHEQGPAATGLSKMELDPADFQGELPEQFWHVYHEDEAIGLFVGVWTTTSMQESFGPYPGNEFMYLLEGQVAMLDENDQATIIEQGETFCVRNGIPTSWKQVGSARKFFVIYAPPNAVEPVLSPDEKGISILRPDELASRLTLLETTAPFEIDGQKPEQRDAMAFSSDDEKMVAGMWDSTPFESTMAPFPCHEFVQLLKGNISITEENGQTSSFSPGDVFFIPQGTVCSWKVQEPVRKLYCIVDPDLAPSAG